MKRMALLTATLLMITPLVFGDFTALIQKAELLNDQEKNEAVRELLEKALAEETDNARKAEIAWRLSRAYMYLGDDGQRAGMRGRDLLPYFEKGEEYGQMAIDFDPGNFRGYFWKAGNSGRWGQIKGVLQALAKAKQMRVLLREAVRLNPEDKGSYYILGQLYREVPGRPLGFGNIERAVSLGRRAVDLMEREVAQGLEERYDFDYYTELAKSLYQRNWSVDRRQRRARENRSRWQAQSDPREKYLYYESSVSLPPMSDRDEARELVRKAIHSLEAIRNRKNSENDDLQEARDTLRSFK